MTDMEGNMDKAEKKPLSGREKLFCHCYLRTLNAREAAAAAGYSWDTCKSAGEKLLGREEIRLFLQELSQRQEGRKGQTKQALVDGLTRLAFGSTADCVRLAFMETEPDRETLEQLDLFSLCELKRAKGVTEIKLYDRFQALDALAGLLREREEGVLPLYEALEKGADALRAPGKEDD